LVKKPENRSQHAGVTHAPWMKRTVLISCATLRDRFRRLDG
jgi:hypothetical protein